MEIACVLTASVHDWTHNERWYSKANFLIMDKYQMDRLTTPLFIFYFFFLFLPHVHPLFQTNIVQSFSTSFLLPQFDLSLFLYNEMLIVSNRAMAE